MEKKVLQKRINDLIKDFNKNKRIFSDKKLMGIAKVTVSNYLRNKEFIGYLRKNPHAARTIMDAYKKYLSDETKKEFEKLYT